jgi:uncharacterized delta-60 repeat protein
VERLEERALLNAGDFDPTFGTSGIATHQFTGPGNNQAEAAVVQTDGKLVVVGDVNVVNPSGPAGVNMARFNADGSLDATFGIGGRVITGSVGLVVTTAAIQADGKILVAGQHGGDFGLVRYNPDGTLDATFGAGGLVTTDFAGTLDQAFAVAVQADGRIVVAGRAEDSTTASDFGLVRYNEDGSLDTSFGASGKVITDFGQNIESATSIVIQADGKILAAGYTSVVFGNSDFALARYNVNGSLDTSFGSGGLVRTDFGNIDDGKRVVVESSGKIVFAGTSYISDSPIGVAALARYNADGSLDTTFGTGGLVTSTFLGSGGVTPEVTGLALQADGNILVGGTAADERGFAVARFSALDGSLDSTFGTAGIASAAFGGFAGARDLVRQGSNIVQVGWANQVGTGVDFAVARFLPTGMLDAGFSADGTAVVDFGDLNNSAGNVVLIQPDAKLLLVATVSLPMSVDDHFGLVRFNADGTLDGTFGVGGEVTTALRRQSSG